MLFLATVGAVIVSVFFFNQLMYFLKIFDLKVKAQSCATGEAMFWWAVRSWVFP